MSMNRRNFIRASAASAGAVTLLAGATSCSPAKDEIAKGPLDDLKSMADDIVPITIEERRSRIGKAQQLMTDNRIDAIFLDGGTSMEYFTGVRW